VPALSFLRRFEQSIVGAFKRQTCRLARRRPIRVGDDLHLFVGMRTKECRKLAVVSCISTWPVVVTRNTLRVAGVRRYDLDSFACADGFRNWGEFVQAIDELHGLPFRGDVITWSHPALPRQQPRTRPTRSRPSPSC
jgi:hypothetical protein